MVGVSTHAGAIDHTAGIIELRRLAMTCVHGGRSPGNDLLAGWLARSVNPTRLCFLETSSCRRQPPAHPPCSGRQLIYVDRDPVVPLSASSQGSSVAVFMRPSYMPHYASCPSVSPSVCLSHKSEIIYNHRQESFRIKTMLINVYMFFLQ